VNVGVALVEEMTETHFI